MQEFSSYKEKLLTEQIEEQILDYITKEQIESGKKLPNEFILAEKFGVGRSTLREAVKLLVARGVLEVRHGSGTYVTSSMPLDNDPLHLREIEDKISLAMDIVNVRLILEPEIAALAALNATEEDIKRLRELCSMVEDKIINDEPYIKEDIEFHAFIAKCSKNVVMGQLIPIIDTAVLLFVNITHKALKRETIETHRAITDAIQKRDYIGAKTAMLMHIIYNRDKIKEIKDSRNSDR
ncbi:FadR/GntR family transcriptional regulator [Kineothrix sp. MB12-C1]|uniref:FadR/GntR family transcriptional regulator n=1 Tax=Kineothrix sp. MB12-C1 TaxID=3070215 RepID=UPI0027D2133A|nr:FadR/GntR family transcriptional regulator [Kineothrix sp. MB12-C1]WMC91175.1 FadR/GntR family transcriptional regulator [Kineothrix sp. MB12-C1]